VVTRAGLAARRGQGRRGGPREEDAMFARVTTIQGEPGRTPSPDVLQNVLERGVATFREQAGFQGLYFLAERDTGEHLAITLWDTEQQAAAVPQGPGRAQLREEAGRQVGATAAPVGKTYEVIARA
jgi:hypothetical protein